MARRSAMVVLQAIESAVRVLHGLLVEIDALADRIRTAPMWRRICSSGDHKQEIDDRRDKLKLQLQLLMGAASLKVVVHAADVLSQWTSSSSQSAG